ncbi:MAG: FAD-dependent oxidoreductase [Firmicutes bacterium]|nr:FAD-dependent oxidoreductase [Bacillota bacterium]
MPQVIVVGGGWAGCAAAAGAARNGAEVILLERSDVLLGSGLGGGLVQNNGRYTAMQELKVMGAGDLIEAMESVFTHRSVDFPSHKHAALYDVTRIERAVRRSLMRLGVQIRTGTRVKEVRAAGGHLEAVISEDREVFGGDAFADCTGTAGPQGNCTKYGQGCSLCVYGCPTYGARVSIAGRMGISEICARRADGGYGVMTGSCLLVPESMGEERLAELRGNGVLLVPIPTELQHQDLLALKACQQYASPEFAANLVLLDTGLPKMMAPFFPLGYFRKLPGFEDVVYHHPFAGTRGNSIRYLAMAPHDDTLLVDGTDNLFCAGEKSGLLNGHIEAVATGALAGFNAVRRALGKTGLVLTRETAVGESVAFVREAMDGPGGLQKTYTFSGGPLFGRMKDRGLYSTDFDAIEQRVREAGAEGILAN